MIKQDYLVEEARLLETRLRGLDEETVKSFNLCKSFHRTLCSPGKPFTMYRWMLDGPSILHKVTCLAARMSVQDGFSSTWTIDDRIISVTHTPVEIYDSIFLWHPFSGLIKFDDKHSASIPICVKQLDNPFMYKREGQVYLAESHLMHTL